MTWWQWLLLVVAVAATPVGLLIAFVAYAAAKALLLLITVIGFVVDVWNNYTWFRVLGPWPWRGQRWKDRTVTARVQVGVDLGETWALRLARFLNWLDHGHVRMPKEQE